MVAPPVQEEQTPIAQEKGSSHWGDEQQIDWTQRMIFYAAGMGYFSSYHDDVSADGTRSCPTDAG
ncbi:UNVERIFIED_CONTAM: hypothetical protein Sradi_2641800 [Sesamum radiatum]|uniref:Uncharacterized protein n=1 Tax=Sesamum radiatum TaxID=300843 RepID=A0AAW2S6A1_SESRA